MRDADHDEGIVAIIPARSGSKGVPNKNIRPLNGKPLIAYSIKAALMSNMVERVIVSTDSEAYAEIALKWGAEVPFLRPADISGDSASDLQFFQHVISWFEDTKQPVPDFLVHLRPTTPLRDPSIIDEAIKTFMQGGFTALRSCHQMSESSYKTFEIEDQKLKSLIDGSFNIESANSNRQSLPPTFDANGYVDVIRSDLVRSAEMVHGDRVMAYVTEKAYEIDEFSDIELLEYMLLKNPEIEQKLFDGI